MIIGLTGVFLYNVSRRSEPRPGETAKKGAVLPPPRVHWSDPALWISAPVDLTYRPYETFTGPYSDPRRAYILPGGTRVSMSGYNPESVVQTNQAWTVIPVDRSGDQLPPFTESPIMGIGEKRVIDSKR